MALYTQKLIERGMPPKEARLRARLRRPRRWPSLDDIVTRAIEQRLAEEDLRGPWHPLSAEEEEDATLAGRRPGNKNYPGFLKYRAYELPSDLVVRLRTTAVRVSEEPLAELEALGLTYNRPDYESEQWEQREALVELVFSVPRIVRQGLERYGPWPWEEWPPSAPIQESPIS
ncbi:hypothetical protein [Streptomyces scopuliridis]|uniref:hypothetical protein n=1 Tax=Streptomyces scopuliridis TaxID=452529 RepID=UPI00368B6A70